MNVAINFQLKIDRFNFLIQPFFPPQEKKKRISSKNTHPSNNLFRVVFQGRMEKPEAGIRNPETETEPEPEPELKLRPG